MGEGAGMNINRIGALLYYTRPALLLLIFALGWFMAGLQRGFDLAAYFVLGYFIGDVIRWFKYPPVYPVPPREDHEE